MIWLWRACSRRASSSCSRARSSRPASPTRCSRIRRHPIPSFSCPPFCRCEEMSLVLRISRLAKEFRLHLQGGTRIPVFDDLALELDAGDALAIIGPSGMGKSSLLKLIYGTYKPNHGEILVR